jgi:hypothetical protein
MAMFLVKRKKRGRGSSKNEKGPIRRRRGLFWVKVACL